MPLLKIEYGKELNYGLISLKHVLKYIASVPPGSNVTYREVHHAKVGITIPTAYYSIISTQHSSSVGLLTLSF